MLKEHQHIGKRKKTLLKLLSVASVVGLAFSGFAGASEVNPVDYLPQTSFGVGNNHIYYKAVLENGEYVFKESTNSDYDFVVNYDNLMPSVDIDTDVTTVLTWTYKDYNRAINVKPSGNVKEN